MIWLDIGKHGTKMETIRRAKMPAGNTGGVDYRSIGETVPILEWLAVKIFFHIITQKIKIKGGIVGEYGKTILCIVCIEICDK